MYSYVHFENGLFQAYILLEINHYQYAIFLAQSKNPCKKDWSEQVNEDIENIILNILLLDSRSGMTKSSDYSK